MKILIATGLYPPDIGGPAQYAKHLYDECTRRGHEVVVVSFRLERKMPAGVRHFFYFARLIAHIKKVNAILATDTFSVGLPAVLAGKMFSKRVVIRVGGDFLWESYVEATGKKITLSEFNANMPLLSGKLKTIYRLSRFVLQNASALAFNTAWQKDIFQKAYAIPSTRLFVVENFYGERTGGEVPTKKNFLWAGRMIALKNIPLLSEAFEEARKNRDDMSLEIITGIPQEELFKRIKKSYAVILPSYSDVHPNVIIDAVRCGKPFVMTKETGLYERFRGIGLFVDPFDKKDMAQKILFLADDKNYKKQKEKVENFHFRHSWEQIADEFISILKNS